jgi:hypothetical protein
VFLLDDDAGPPALLNFNLALVQSAASSTSAQLHSSIFICTSQRSMRCCTLQSSSALLSVVCSVSELKLKSLWRLHQSALFVISGD